MTACPEEHPLRGRVCDDGKHARAWFCKLEDYLNVMSKMKDLVDERASEKRTIKDRSKVSESFRGKCASSSKRCVLL